MKLNLNDAYYLAAGESKRLAKEVMDAADSWKEAVTTAVAEVAPESTGRWFYRRSYEVGAIEFRGAPDPKSWRPVKGAYGAYLPRAKTPVGKRWAQLQRGFPRVPDLATHLGLNPIQMMAAGHGLAVRGPSMTRVGGEYIISIPEGALPGDDQPAPADAIHLTPEQAAEHLARQEQVAA